MSDPYFRFYFRFLAPHQASLLRPEETLTHIQNELRAFVGVAFEKLAQQWVATRPDDLPFIPDAIGAHWSRGVQVDVVAINWQSKDILLGECKWGDNDVSRKVVRELIERKGPRLQKKIGTDWTMHYAYFVRRGFTTAARAEAQAYGTLLVELARIDTDLQRAAKAIQ